MVIFKNYINCFLNILCSFPCHYCANFGTLLDSGSIRQHQLHDKRETAKSKMRNSVQHLIVTVLSTIALLHDLWNETIMRDICLYLFTKKTKSKKYKLIFFTFFVIHFKIQIPFALFPFTNLFVHTSKSHLLKVSFTVFINAIFGTYYLWYI